jgi:hypothetical protein
MAKNEQMARERREEDKRQLMEYERIRIEAQELKRKKKEELLRQGKELQNFHLKQMVKKKVGS